MMLPRGSFSKSTIKRGLLSSETWLSDNYFLTVDQRNTIEWNSHAICVTIDATLAYQPNPLRVSYMYTHCVLIVMLVETFYRLEK